jgi:branched-chain amino acid transport system permease protein
MHGVVIGAAAFAYLKDALSAVSPQYWHLGLGIVLMASVFVVRGGIAQGLSDLGRLLARVRK